MYFKYKNFSIIGENGRTLICKPKENLSIYNDVLPEIVDVFKDYGATDVLVTDSKHNINFFIYRN